MAEERKNMEEKKKGFTKWIYYFLLGVAIITVYKLLDNFSQITSWIHNLLDILMPFIIGLLIAYLFYLPCRKIESIGRQAESRVHFLLSRREYKSP